MGLISWITGTSTAEKAISVVSDKLDAAIFTEQERSETAQKFNEWLLKYMEATNPQNVARRLIALVVVALWALLILAGVILHAAGAVELSRYIFETLKEYVIDAFLLIMAFYFAAHVVRANK